MPSRSTSSARCCWARPCCCLLLAAREPPRRAALALVPAVAFLVHERRTAVPVFTHRPVSIAANVAALAAGSAFLGAEVYLPLQLQVGFGEPVCGGRRWRWC